MQVDRKTGQMFHGLGFEKPGYKGHDVEDADPSPKARISESLSDEPENEQFVEGPDRSESVKGILRLLQEGYFKGVADVRLRINFHDGLAAIECAQLRAVAEENVSGLSESIQPTVDTLVGSGRITQDQADTLTGTFRQAVNQSVENFLTGRTSKDALIGELNSGFSAFLAGLAAATTREKLDEGVTPIEDILEEVVAEETRTEMPEQGEQTESAGFVDELTDMFNAALAQFIDGLKDVRILPDSFPPKDSASAYQMFLAVYNELFGLTSEGTNEDTVSLDAIQ
jgi:hypothetical protein